MGQGRPAWQPRRHCALTDPASPPLPGSQDPLPQRRQTPTRVSQPSSTGRPSRRLTQISGSRTGLVFMQVHSRALTGIHLDISHVGIFFSVPDKAICEARGSLSLRYDAKWEPRGWVWGCSKEIPKLNIQSAMSCVIQHDSSSPSSPLGRLPEACGRGDAVFSNAV